MAIHFRWNDGVLCFDVEDTFLPEDAHHIEAAAGAVAGSRPVQVDFRRAREKHMLALWLLAMAARRQPGRFRLTGLSKGDDRFLALAGLLGPADLMH